MRDRIATVALVAGAFRRIVFVCGVLAVWLAIAGAAMACGGTISGPIVARGHIPGQSWDQRACLAGHRRLEVEFDLPQPGYDDGGGMLLPLPSRAQSLTIDAPGVGIGIRHESDIDGVTFSTINQLRLTFAHGPTVTISTRPAPAKLRRRYPYLRHLRFFTVWFAGRRGIPTLVCGIGAHARVSPCFRYAAGGPQVWTPARRASRLRSRGWRTV